MVMQRASAGEWKKTFKAISRRFPHGNYRISKLKDGGLVWAVSHSRLA